MTDIDSLDIFLYSDQPTTCPKCGARTEIIAEFPTSKENTQVHYCKDPNCQYHFVMQEDEEFEKELKLINQEFNL